MTVPVSHYVDTDRWEHEVDRLFRRSPVVVALSAHVPGPGHYTVEVVEERELQGPNWKVAFDGYVDGYHLDILHKDTLGRDVVGNVITCDAWGPHQRVAFARRNIVELQDIARPDWVPASHL